MIKKIKDKIKGFFPEKWPSFYQCRKILKVVNKKEKTIFLIAIAGFIVSLIVLLSFFYFQNTEKVPKAGGKYIEGMIGNPQFLNPIYGSLSDVDRDISNILFSGLVKYESAEELILDLAEEVKIYGKKYEITLKENLYWSDGEKITADDVVFTVKTIQNPKTRSPLRPGWVGVEVEKISEKEVSFRLEQESSIFFNRLSLQLIPSHIWKDVPLENLTLSHYNLEPVSSGPYRIKEKINNQLGKIERINLEINPYYHGEKPFIQEISFVFFNSFQEIVEAAKRKEIHGFSTINPKNNNGAIKETKFKEHFFSIPRYFGLFLNLEKETLKDTEFRKALNYGTDKQEILNKVLSGKGKIVNSPVLPEIYGFNLKEEHEFNVEKANEILDNFGFKKNEQGWRERIAKEAVAFEFKSDLRTGAQGDEVRQLQECLMGQGIYQEEITGFFGTETRDAVNSFQEKYKDDVLVPSGFSKGTGMVSENTRKKLNDVCESSPRITEEINFTVTTVNQSLMEETIEEIKNQWQKIGIKVNSNLLEIGNLENNAIKPRNYEILLFGKALDYVPDFFPFWHSSQKTEYGFNLSMYENEEVDKITEEIRKKMNVENTEEEIKQLNDTIVEDVPAIFLFNPSYIFCTSKNIKGIKAGVIFNPSQRFHNIEEWHLKTRRVWK